MCIITSVLLALIESFLTCLVKIFAQIIYFGTGSPIAGVNPFVSIMEGCAFVLFMRLILGFIFLNSAMWTFIALLKIKISLLVCCLVNGLSIIIMYWVWDSKYNMLDNLFYLREPYHYFGWAQCGLLVSLCSPIVLYKMHFIPNIIHILASQASRGAGQEKSMTSGKVVG
jgi:hypothetical protein